MDFTRTVNYYCKLQPCELVLQEFKIFLLVLQKRFTSNIVKYY
jgi:hypothetical protein